LSGREASILRTVVVQSSPCAGCGAWPRQRDAHHLVGGSWREDVEENLIALGGSGTTGCHGIYTSRMPSLDCRGDRRTWEEVASSIRDHMTNEQELYVIGVKSEDFLERAYPRRKEQTC
jgi:hypothetical protein